MHTRDMEWEALSSEWRTVQVAGPSIPADIRRLVRRQGLRLKLITAVEVVLSIAMLAVVILALVRAPAPVRVAWSIFTVAILAVTWAFALWNRRGVWAPYAESTETFLELTLERCRRSLRTVRFCWALLAVELLAFAPWLWWSLTHDAGWHGPRRLVLLIAWGMAGAHWLGAFTWTFWYRARKRREFERVAADLATVRRG